MRKLLRLAAATAVSASLTTGLAAAQSGSIDTTGPNSHNTVTVRSTNTFRQNNNNHVHASVSNTQRAYSGDARVQNNTNAGDASTGAAMNDNSTSLSASVSNSTPSLGGAGFMGSSEPSATMSTTGPNSHNTINVTSNNSATITNNNTVDVRSTSTQTATSGNATVQNNTNGGSASTGDASNSNSTTVDLNISN
jgi:hypothetical protein